MKQKLDFCRKDLLKYGIACKMFATSKVMDLIYGSIKYSSATILQTGESITLLEWDAHPRYQHTWWEVPLEERITIIKLLIKRCKHYDYYADDPSCFHFRTLCLMHEFLNDEENRVKCVNKYDASGSPQREKKYGAFVDDRLYQNCITEMFLWWHFGIRKDDNERILLKKCWLKFLGSERPHFQRQLLKLVREKIAHLKAERKKAQHLIGVNRYLINHCRNEEKAIKRRHFSAHKKEYLLNHLEARINAAHKRFWKAQSLESKCKTALYFLNGYMDYISIAEKFKPTNPA